MIYRSKDTLQKQFGPTQTAESDAETTEQQAAKTPSHSARSGRATCTQTCTRSCRGIFGSPGGSENPTWCPSTLAQEQTCRWHRQLQEEARRKGRGKLWKLIGRTWWLLIEQESKRKRMGWYFGGVGDVWVVTSVWGEWFTVWSRVVWETTELEVRYQWERGCWG